MLTRGLSGANDAAAAAVAESNASFIESWKNIYPKLPRGEYYELDGLVVVWADSVLPFCNAILLSHPVENAADMQARIDTLREFLAAKTRPPMFLVCQDWLPPDVLAIADLLIATVGLHPAIPLIGMAADHILPPTRPLPHLECRRVCNEETRNLISDINSSAYRFALEYGREVFTLPEAWAGDCYGYVGYRGGTPLTTAASTLLETSVYVGFVATLPGLQRHGYAEVVMRHSLAEAAKNTGLNRSVLHATAEGHRLYLRMGYRNVAKFMGYVKP
jgi:GNAT superfamily N-acetyltransferase